MIDQLDVGISDAEDLLELVIEDNDSEVLKSVDIEILNLQGIGSTNLLLK